MIGRMSMYRVVLYGLVAVLVVALAMAASGTIAYDPLAILANGAVVVVVTGLSGLAFAKVFRVKAQLESSAVTALILLFLFQPSFTVLSFEAVTLAGLIASASKYLLAVRGRHAFNPAAIAAVVMSIAVPSAFPGWWVGSPMLLPVVVVAAFIVLRRTHTLSLGVVFVVVATVGVTLASMSTGSTFASALESALTSTPIVFFAGFMLSEPLTLPPRRWQRLALAVLVGVLFAVPFHVGPVYGTYELALVIGNLLAFAVGQRRGVRLSFVGRESLTPTSWALSFRPDAPVRFRAGQYLELSLPHAHVDVRGMRRTFSITSGAGAGDSLSIGLRTAVPSSSFKTALLDLAPGARLSATLVGGDFVLPRNPAHPVLFVAGGIGITPFISHLLALRDERARDDRARRDVVLVLAVSSAAEVPYLDTLAALGVRVVLASPDAPAPLPADWTWMHGERLTAATLADLVPDADRRLAYLSGSTLFVSRLRPVLRGAGVRRIRTDAFSGY